MKKLLLVIALGGVLYWHNHPLSRVSDQATDSGQAKGGDSSRVVANPILGAPLQISAYVDGTSKLIITKDGLQWVHEGGVKPGIEAPVQPNSVKRIPILVNGNPWVPRWSNSSPILPDTSSVYPLKLRSISYKLETIHARGSVRLTEDSSRLVVKIIDLPPAGEAYSFRLIPLAAKNEEVAEAANTSPRLAPEGSFFLTSRINIPTESGTIGLDAGTSVKQVEDFGDKLTVTNGTVQFSVSRSELTNDVDFAHNIATAVSEARLSGAIISQQQIADVEEKIRLHQIEAEKNRVRELRERREHAIAAAPQMQSDETDSDNPLSRGAYDRTTAFRKPSVGELNARAEADQERKAKEQAAADRQVNQAAINRLEAERRNSLPLKNDYLQRQQLDNARRDEIQARREAARLR